VKRTGDRKEKSPKTTKGELGSVAETKEPIRIERLQKEKTAEQMSMPGWGSSKVRKGTRRKPRCEEEIPARRASKLENELARAGKQHHKRAVLATYERGGARDRDEKF